MKFKYLAIIFAIFIASCGSDSGSNNNTTSTQTISAPSTEQIELPDHVNN